MSRPRAQRRRMPPAVHSDAAHEAIRAYLVRRTLETHGGANVPTTLQLLATVVLVPLALSLLALALSALAQHTWR